MNHRAVHRISPIIDAAVAAGIDDVADLITDVLLWVKHHGDDPDDVLNRALMHFSVESSDLFEEAL